MSTTLFTDAAKSLSERYKLECMDPLEILEYVVAFYPVYLDVDRLTTERDLFSPM